MLSRKLSASAAFCKSQPFLFPLALPLRIRKLVHLTLILGYFPPTIERISQSHIHCGAPGSSLHTCIPTHLHPSHWCGFVLHF